MEERREEKFLSEGSERQAHRYILKKTRSIIGEVGCQKNQNFGETPYVLMYTLFRNFWSVLSSGMSLEKRDCELACRFSPQVILKR